MSATPDAPSSTAAYERYVDRAQDRAEPTRVRTIRQRYAQQLRGRWRAIRAAIREAVVENDALGLQTEALVDAPQSFDFGTDAEKVDAFNRWLQRQTDREILQRFGQDNSLIRDAYERGVRDANTELQALGLSEGSSVGTSIRLPVHESQLQRLYTRNFNELEGMVDAVSTELRRELSEGLAAGDGPRTIARNLSDAIGKVEDGTPRAAMNRATMIARTELMNSHNAARLQEWERAGVKQVDVLLAPDACEQCEAYASRAPYPASEAYGNLPRHPNCKCTHTVHTNS